MNTSPHASADTWVLLAIIYGGGTRGATLTDIISAGDYINHAILRYEELRDGLARLLAAGVIVERDGCYYPTPEALAAYRQPIHPRRFISTEWDALEQWLASRLRDTPVAEQSITRSAYARSVRVYRERCRVV